jgi:ABC-2 type transport system ATP-binding protein
MGVQILTETSRDLFILKDITKQYSSGKMKRSITTVLDNINLSIQAGEAIAITGANGSGKTTLMHIIMGLFHPTSGEVYFKGKKITSEISKSISFTMPNGKGLIKEMTVEDYLKFRAYLISEAIPDPSNQYMVTLGVERLLKKKIQFCSTGEAQKVNLMANLIGDPEIIILDEPTSGLDINTKFEFLDLLEKLKEQGKTIILISHHIDELQKMNRLIVLKSGKVDYDGDIPHRNLDSMLRDMCKAGESI